MSAVDPDLGASMRAYLDRDWGIFERLRDRELPRRRGRQALSSALQVVQQLHASARSLRPEWPMEAEREADLEAHRRLAAALARTAGVREITSRSKSVKVDKTIDTRSR